MDLFAAIAIYMSNYKRGLTILDITNPGAPTEAGYLDTYSLSDAGNPFSGAWGAYPYLPSGTIAISDIGSGLHLVRDTSLATAQGTLSFTQASFGGVEGNDISVTVSRNGGNAGAISVDYMLVPGTADATDFTNTTGTLNWANGDSADKTITLGTATNSDALSMERALIKLVAPTGGATLSAPSVASAYVSDGGNAAIEFDRAFARGTRARLWPCDRNGAATR